MTGRPVRIVDVQTVFEVQHPTAEFTFGAAVAGALTFAQARVRIEDAEGGQADGWGAILLSYPWAFPSSALDEETRDGIMRRLLSDAGQWLVDEGQTGHPIDHFLALESHLGEIEAAISAEMGDHERIPRMATLVAISPLDGAIHDAYGRLHGVSAFETLSPEFTGWEPADVMGPDYAGLAFSDVLRSEPVEELPVYHTVGGSDAIRSTGDGASLEQWIRDDGVFAFKVKLKGKDLEWDTRRLLEVYRLGWDHAGERVRMFADLNETAPDLAYVEALLGNVAAEEPKAIAALDAIEQPDRRDMAEAAMDFRRLQPPMTIALDEGLVSLEAISRAHELGYKGLCLKTCKTQSLMLLALLAAHRYGMSVTVQDLTNPGIALHQSLGLAARLPQTMPVETNQRQFYPNASRPEAEVWPTLYRVRDGVVDVREISGPGFGFDPAKIQREIFQR